MSEITAETGAAARVITGVVSFDSFYLRSFFFSSFHTRKRSLPIESIAVRVVGASATKTLKKKNAGLYSSHPTYLTSNVIVRFRIVFV